MRSKYSFGVSVFDFVLDGVISRTGSLYMELFSAIELFKRGVVVPLREPLALFQVQTRTLFSFLFTIFLFLNHKRRQI
jgi:hypothetical protein